MKTANTEVQKNAAFSRCQARNLSFDKWCVQFFEDIQNGYAHEFSEGRAKQAKLDLISADNEWQFLWKAMKDTTKATPF